ncbi:unannotated protein [freshwater metagenome]|uniref:Unannotated protein n=1 Tax=freshwater metagenome TaxID=449393 RepID=A0A6J6D4Q8_9ZZZZ
MTNQSNWTALNPAGGIDADYSLTVLINNSAAIIFNDSVFFIKRNPRQFRAKVTNGSVDRLHIELAVLASVRNSAGAGISGAFKFNAGYFATGANYFNRLVPEVQVQSALGSGGLSGAPFV